MDKLSAIVCDCILCCAFAAVHRNEALTLEKRALEDHRRQLSIQNASLAEQAQVLRNHLNTEKVKHEQQQRAAHKGATRNAQAEQHQAGLEHQVSQISTITLIAYFRQSQVRMANADMYLLHNGAATQC